VPVPSAVGAAAAAAATLVGMVGLWLVRTSVVQLHCFANPDGVAGGLTACCCPAPAAGPRPPCCWGGGVLRCARRLLHTPIRVAAVDHSHLAPCSSSVGGIIC
jgi:hypothetical protein